MITVKNLTFDYPGTRALNDVSFSIRPGSITALVGPNGAGKTTLLRCLAALEEPAAGDILMDGRSILDDPRATHRTTGYLSDFFGLYEELTVRRCLEYAALSHGVAPERQEEKIVRCAGLLDLGDRLEVKAGSLSRGQRQRLAIAQAIIHEPRFLLLDEPASGLDPEARHSLAALFRRLRDAGMTLLVSSHILAELEEYSTDMLVLRNGRIIDHAPLDAAASGTVLEIRLASSYEGLSALLSSSGQISNVVCNQDGATFTFSSDRSQQHRLLEALLKKGVPVCSFAEQQKNLQEAYLKTVRTRGGA